MEPDKRTNKITIFYDPDNVVQSIFCMIADDPQLAPLPSFPGPDYDIAAHITSTATEPTDTLFLFLDDSAVLTSAAIAKLSAFGFGKICTMGDPLQQNSSTIHCTTANINEHFPLTGGLLTTYLFEFMKCAVDPSYTCTINEDVNHSKALALLEAIKTYPDTVAEFVAELYSSYKAFDIIESYIARGYGHLHERQKFAATIPQSVKNFSNFINTSWPSPTTKTIIYYKLNDAWDCSLISSAHLNSIRNHLPAKKITTLNEMELSEASSRD